MQRCTCEVPCCSRAWDWDNERSRWYRICETCEGRVEMSQVETALKLQAMVERLHERQKTGQL